MTEPRSIYPKDFFGEPVPRRNTGFILMPFDDELEPVHEAIRAAIEQARLEPLRADDIFSTRSGMEKILRGIAEAEVIVADMTGRNANVFYETGIAHTVKHNVVLLTQDIDDIPFDFRHIDHIEYAPTATGLKVLADGLHKVIAGLAPEPPPEVSTAQPLSTTPTTPSSTRKELRRLRQDCERRWNTEVVPAQEEVFQERFNARIQSSRSQAEFDSAILEATATIQPAFLRPWKPIEDLGLTVIEEDEDYRPLLPDFLKALEHAYSLSKRCEGTATVVGHSQLLVLRTWIAWGAYALSRENWGAVEDLLHQRVAFDKPGWARAQRESFAEHRTVFTPDACGISQGYGSSDVAMQSVLQQVETLAPQWFGDSGAAQGYLGIWLLAADIAQASGRDNLTPDWPVWPYAPESEFLRLFPLLQDDPDYARGFARAVAKVDPAELNRLWKGGLRSKLMDRRGLGTYGMRLMMRDIPEQFAEGS